MDGSSVLRNLSVLKIKCLHFHTKIFTLSRKGLDFNVEFTLSHSCLDICVKCSLSCRVFAFLQSLCFHRVAWTFMQSFVLSHRNVYTLTQNVLQFYTEFMLCTQLITLSHRRL